MQDILDSDPFMSLMRHAVVIHPQHEVINLKMSGRHFVLMWREAQPCNLQAAVSPAFNVAN